MERYESLFRKYFDKNLKIMDNFLQASEKGTLGEKGLRTLARVFHNVKSSAAMMEYNEISLISESMEKILNVFIKRGMKNNENVSLIELLREVKELFEKISVQKNIDGTKIAPQLSEKIRLIERKMCHEP